MVRYRPAPLKEMAIRLAIDIAKAEAISLSRVEPHRVFWIHVLKCPGCRKHAVGLCLSSSESPKPKYVLCTIINGEVIPRMRN